MSKSQKRRTPGGWKDPVAKAAYDRERWERLGRGTYSERRPLTERAYRESHREQIRAAERKRMYGLTLEQYEAMIEAQGGKCAICGKHMEKPHVDHDHMTGEVRGLLCRRCNLALGIFGEDISILRAAVRYLAKSRLL